jgi:putative membrane protein
VKGGARIMDTFYGTWGAFGLGWILLILFWIVIVLGIITLIRWLAGYSKNDYHHGCRYCNDKYMMDKHSWMMGKDWKKEPGKGMGREINTRDEEYMKILKERYARGDISKEEFEIKKKDLM